jgi:hypothetical protein
VRADADAFAGGEGEGGDSRRPAHVKPYAGMSYRTAPLYPSLDEVNR